MLPCNCTAFSFPHRPGGGRCTDPGPERECEDCEFSEEFKFEFDRLSTGRTHSCKLDKCLWR